jgi:Transposase DNA-binding/Transposase Tn5 dimerisation domain
MDTAEAKDFGGRPVCDSGWAEGELEGVELGDARLERRLIRVVEDLSSQPEYPVNQACEDAAATKAAYRLFDNDKVNTEKIFIAHRAKTICRMRQEPLVLAIQDTTFFNFTGHKKTRGLGPIGDQSGKLQGLILHSTFAVTPSGLPLGVLTHDCWARTGFRENEFTHEKLPIEEKESYRWVETLREISQLSVSQRNSMVVTVADRECDIYEFLLEAQLLNAKYVIRAAHNRYVLDSEHKYIHDGICATPVRGQVEVTVPSQQRTAVANVRFSAITLCAPERLTKSKNKLNVVGWVISVEEVKPPAGVEAISWMLLTNVPVTSLDHAVERVSWYRRRWSIEEFHKVLKSGCMVEKSRLQTAARLKRYIALLCIIAWRIFWLVHLQRADPGAPAEVALTQAEIGPLRSLKRFTGRFQQSTAMTVRQAVIAIACLGGYLNRKNDPPPGATTVWRGWQRLASMSELYESIVPGCG